MKINEEIGEVLLSERSVLMLFWDKNDGWQVAGNGDLSIDAALLKNEGLEGLRAVVKDSDLGLFDAFLERVKMLRWVKPSLPEQAVFLTPHSILKQLTVLSGTTKSNVILRQTSLAS